MGKGGTFLKGIKGVGKVVDKSFAYIKNRRIFRKIYTATKVAGVALKEE